MDNAGSFGLYIFPSMCSTSLPNTMECKQQLRMEDFILPCDMKFITFLKTGGRNSWQRSFHGVRRADESHRFNSSHHKLSHLSVNVCM